MDPLVFELRVLLTKAELDFLQFPMGRKLPRSLRAKLIEGVHSKNAPSKNITHRSLIALALSSGDEEVIELANELDARRGFTKGYMPVKAQLRRKMRALERPDPHV